VANPAGGVFTRAFSTLWLATLVTYFGFQALAASLPLLAERLGADDIALGLLTGLIAAVAVVVRPIVGWWTDRRDAAGPLVLGSLIFGLCALGYWLASSVGTLLAFRAITGLAIALFGTASQVLAANLAPVARRGEAMSLFAAAVTFAVGVGPPVGVAVVRLIDYPGLFAFCIVTSLLGAVCASLLRGRAGDPIAPGHRRLINSTVLAPGLLLSTVTLAYGVNLALLAIHASRRGLTNPGLVFLAYAAGVFATQGIAGRLSDRHGRFAVIGPGLGLTAAGMWATALLSGWWLFLAGALSGAGYGASQPLLYALAADMVPVDERGSAMGTVGIFHEGGIAAGAIGGGLVSQAVGLGPMFGLAGLAPACAALFAFLRRTDKASRARSHRATER
jgi:MFS family permease